MSFFRRGSPSAVFVCLRAVLILRSIRLNSWRTSKARPAASTEALVLSSITLDNLRSSVISWSSPSTCVE
ncbi:hypothetical protein DPMN_115770 [Dreissena polymorpha]|uniref:Uncharacterized protein n=1 Tax=Dreissena polymorpha TaxID=45954 RepID=A0A9D4KLV7_DREPO|nr:hypothetical protein DPMN_115770 [Dreissena polymorpha]